MRDYFKEEKERIAVENTLLENEKKQVEIQKTIIGELDDAWSIVQRCQANALEANEELAVRYDPILKLIGHVRGLHEDSIKAKQKSITEHIECIYNLEFYISDVLAHCDEEDEDF